MKKLPSLFGSENKTVYLQTLLLYGPCSGRDISRRSGIDHHEEHRISSLFLRQGIICRTERQQLSLNDNFVAALELKRFLSSESHIDRTLLTPLENSTLNTDELSAIFGGIGRTRIIAAISRAEDGLTVSQLARQCGMDKRNVRNAIQTLVADRIIESDASVDAFSLIRSDDGQTRHLRLLIKTIADALLRDSDQGASLDSAGL